MYEMTPQEQKIWEHLKKFNPFAEKNCIGIRKDEKEFLGYHAIFKFSEMWKHHVKHYSVKWEMTIVI
jgi:hypothetical protein